MQNPVAVGYIYSPDAYLGNDCNEKHKIDSILSTQWRDVSLLTPINIILFLLIIVICAAMQDKHS